MGQRTRLGKYPDIAIPVMKIPNLKEVTFQLSFDFRDPTKTALE